jgi:hypothetical protein
MVVIRMELFDIVLQNGLRRIHLAIRTAISRLVVLFETGERTVIHRVRVLCVRNALYRIVLPVKIAGFDGRFEAGKQLGIITQILLLLTAMRR